MVDRVWPMKNGPHMWSLRPKFLKVANSDFFRKGIHLLAMSWGKY